MTTLHASLFTILLAGMIASAWLLYVRAFFLQSGKPMPLPIRNDRNDRNPYATGRAKRNSIIFPR